MRKQRQARKGLVPDPLWHSELAHEENWRGNFRFEVKSGNQVKGVASRYLAAENQSLMAKPFGDLRPFAFIAMPDGWGSEGLVVVRKSVFAALLRGGESVPHEDEGGERQAERDQVDLDGREGVGERRDDK
jgi:hypothetical protein